MLISALTLHAVPAVQYGREEGAETVIEQMTRDQVN